VIRWTSSRAAGEMTMSAVPTVNPRFPTKSMAICWRAKIISRARPGPYSRAIRWKRPPRAPSPTLFLSRTPPRRAPRFMTVWISEGR